MTTNALPLPVLDLTVVMPGRDLSAICSEVNRCTPHLSFRAVRALDLLGIAMVTTNKQTDENSEKYFLEVFFMVIRKCM